MSKRHRQLKRARRLKTFSTVPGPWTSVAGCVFFGGVDMGECCVSHTVRMVVGAGPSFSDVKFTATATLRVFDAETLAALTRDVKEYFMKHRHV